MFWLDIFKQLLLLLSIRREKLVWKREITILDLQAWDSHIMRESWQLYHVPQICHYSVPHFDITAVSVIYYWTDEQKNNGIYLLN